MKANHPEKSLVWSWFQIVLLALPFLVLVPLWDKFPQTVPIHWDLDGRANGWAAKGWGLLLLPVTNLGLATLFAVLPRFDRRSRERGPEVQANLRRVLKIIGLSTTGFLSAMALLIDAVALGWKIDFVLLVNLGVLLLFAALGNYMPKLQPNHFAGFRTPWTLKSPEVWTRTHRVFGRIMLGGALALVPFCLLLPVRCFFPLLLIYALGLVAGSMIYSYVCYRELSAANPSRKLG